ncbi:MAG TPA: NTF2 fold immunity protein [Cyclobacteriaceae bacterium]|nr:YbbC/YhhH family protein [Cyclobacteriaceae bacterium]HMV10377.1 NTF2 fold immunity protein [Cyclobacteriaceae bacterium]HMV90942.1 NTF2 fold immunity protein [Cyclobacteriaceae bacterium]HMX00402.1 NTF2 fold immunity protein [Cyclobacteriaceae bacterium]HMX50514.1 NTF2 fold immunity protein [Cyclobacteriaceae bacterium]
MKLLLTGIFIQMSLFCCGQSDSRIILGEEFAKVELEQSLADTTLHNVVRKQREIIKDKKTAVSVAEQILFAIYGQTNIKKQRPYKIYKIKNYWSISGTLEKRSVGGTFLIIMDARDGRIIRITHGK